MQKISENTPEVVAENCQMIKEMVRDFCEKEIRPHMMEWDESQEFTVPLFKKLGELGLMGEIGRAW